MKYWSSNPTWYKFNFLLFNNPIPFYIEVSLPKSPASFSVHSPPSVVLLWIHAETGDDPNSLLQETLMLYRVMAFRPGTSQWKGGTAALMNLVVITSPFLELTSFTFGSWRTQVTDLIVPKQTLLVQIKGLTLIWHLVIGEKPLCPGDHVSISLLDCLSVTWRSDTGLGRTETPEKLFQCHKKWALEQQQKILSYLWC